MRRLLVKKIAGTTLILTSFALLFLKLQSAPESYASWEAWAHPGPVAPWIALVVGIEVASLVARFALGYSLVAEKRVAAWAFYPLCIAMAINGLLSVLLAAGVVALRLWPENERATET